MRTRPNGPRRRGASSAGPRLPHDAPLWVPAMQHRCPPVWFVSDGLIARTLQTAPAASVPRAHALFWTPAVDNPHDRLPCSGDPGGTGMVVLDCMFSLLDPHVGKEEAQ